MTPEQREALALIIADAVGDHATLPAPAGTPENAVCRCNGVEYERDQFNRHVADAALAFDETRDLIVTWLAEARAEGAAEVVARVEAVMRPMELDGDYNPYAVIRAALKGAPDA